MNTFMTMPPEMIEKITEGLRFGQDPETVSKEQMMECIHYWVCQHWKAKLAAEDMVRKFGERRAKILLALES